MFIDSHTHLNFSHYDTDRPMVIGNAKKAGVKQFVVPGVDDNANRTAVHLAHIHPGVVFAAVGYHPYEAPKSPDLSLLRQYIEHDVAEQKNGSAKHIVAIGECGLDYHIYKGEMAAGRKDVQRELFRQQLRIALEYSLPIIIHVRDAFDDMFEELAALPAVPRGVIHCFSGGGQDIRSALSFGLYMGIDGNVTYSKHLQNTVPDIPLDRLLLETDAPYLTPEPHRGERNEPKYIPTIAKTIAQIHSCDLTTLETHTTQNAIALFQLDEASKRTPVQA